MGGFGEAPNAYPPSSSILRENTPRSPCRTRSQTRISSSIPSPLLTIAAAPTSSALTNVGASVSAVKTMNGSSGYRRLSSRKGLRGSGSSVPSRMGSSVMIRSHCTQVSIERSRSIDGVVMLTRYGECISNQAFSPCVVNVQLSAMARRMKFRKTVLSQAVAQTSSTVYLYSIERSFISWQPG